MSCLPFKYKFIFLHSLTTKLFFDVIKIKIKMSENINNLTIPNIVQMCSTRLSDTDLDKLIVIPRGNASDRNLSEIETSMFFSVNLDCVKHYSDIYQSCLQQNINDSPFGNSQQPKPSILFLIINLRHL